MQDDAKPVAWLYENEEGSRELILNCNGEYARRLLDFGYAGTPLYAHPPAPAQPADVERLVAVFRALPLEGDAGCDKLTDSELATVARAALAAMPVASSADADAGLVEAVQAFFPNIDTGNSNVPDDTIIPLDVTMGELRKLKAALGQGGVRS